MDSQLRSYPSPSQTTTKRKMLLARCTTEVLATDEPKQSSGSHCRDDVITTVDDESEHRRPQPLSLTPSPEEPHIKYFA